MESLLRFLLKIGSVFVTALPARYRRRWPLQRDEDLRGPAIVSGALQFLIGAPGTTLYFAVAMETATEGWGLAGLILNPALPFVWLFVEGGVRAFGAIGPGQILPTLPLQIVAWIQDRQEGKIAEAGRGSLMVDQVERGDGNPWDLRVLSCRPKPHWNSYVTIRHGEQFFQMIGEEQVNGPRKFAYLLRKNPETRLVVVVFEYQTEEGLCPDAPPRRWHP